jgi:DNA-binding CsgD family transcriptional regulator
VSAVRFDAIRAIESCYAPAASDADWLRNLIAAMEPLAGAMPPAALTYDLGEGRLRIGTFEGAHDPEFWSEIKSSGERLDPETASVWFSPVPPAGMSSERLARTRPEARRRIRSLFESWGTQDSLGLVAREADGRGVLLMIPYSERVRIPPQTLHRLGCLTAHMGSAQRLRARGAASLALDEGDVEAVLEPGGKVHHAAGAARDAPSRAALTSAAQALERARGRLRRTSPDEAVASWQGLVEGRWSLVDHGEADGRRFILARRNELGARDPKALAPRERDVLALAALGHSNKHIGYTLGIAPNTVATHLASAMAKMGLRSRRQVIAMLGPMARPPGR